MNVLNRLLHRRLTQVAFLLAGLVLAAAVAAPLLSPYDPITVVLAEKLQPPSTSHWLGTDHSAATFSPGSSTPHEPRSVR